MPKQIAKRKKSTPASQRAVTTVLQIIDISLPSKPLLVGSAKWVGNYGNTEDLAVSNNYAFAVGDDGLKIINTSEPSHPFVVGSFNASRNEYEYSSVAVLGNYTYVTGVTNTYYGTLNAFDITNPTNPNLIGKFHFGSNFAEYSHSTVVRNYVLVLDFEQGGVNKKSKSHLLIVDPTRPSNLQLIGNYSMLGFAGEVAVSGNCAYLTRYYKGNISLDVINISNPARPTFLNYLPISSFFNTTGVNLAVSGNYAYLTDTNILCTVSITDPNKPPKLINRYYLGEKTAIGIVASGNYVFITEGEALSNKYVGFQVINMANSSHPTLVGTYTYNNTLPLPLQSPVLITSEKHIYLLSWYNGVVSLMENDKLRNVCKTPTCHDNTQSLIGATKKHHQVFPKDVGQTRRLSSVELLPVSSIGELTQTSGAANLRNSLASMPYNFLKNTISGFLDRICSVIENYAAGVVSGCPNYFPPNNPHYWTANTAGTMFSESKFAIASNATLIASSRIPNLLN